MGTYTYQPVHAGLVCDPESEGGQVVSLVLYTGPERDGVPAAASTGVSRLADGRYAFTLPDGLADGRYWGAASFIPAQGVPAVTDRTVRLDLPVGGALLVSPEQIAEEVGIPLPLTAAQREALRVDIGKAQADVSSYLGRPLIPRPHALRGVSPLYGYDLSDARAWPAPSYDDITTVLSYTPTADGHYDVRLLVGLHAAEEEPIVRYVVAHATEMIRNKPGSGDGERRVTSVSAEGQSVSYDSAPVTGQAGALPALDSLSGYRKLLYRPIVGAPAVAWPYGRGRRYSRW
ncbi:hypothetical protein OHS33_38720 (plasmid) [Streptomyces sp. NBC_00536]|uniref:hypothetical protein n=1 Tax=Streptomyces sp. NBC_00536 TaxID=2975769 RepID=UPI002E802839|nr:hypothetical protein [Streptomyces sp. NBC_00536]WUC84437.1 hypothetical protein OHS33_38720 [Streptomyces sp. NBC_00536]